MAINLEVRSENGLVCEQAQLVCIRTSIPAAEPRFASWLASLSGEKNGHFSSPSFLTPARKSRHRRQ